MADELSLLIPFVTLPNKFEASELPENEKQICLELGQLLLRVVASEISCCVKSLLIEWEDSLKVLIVFNKFLPLHYPLLNLLNLLLCLES